MRTSDSHHLSQTTQSAETSDNSPQLRRAVGNILYVDKREQREGIVVQWGLQLAEKHSTPDSRKVLVSPAGKGRLRRSCGDLSAI